MKLYSFGCSWTLGVGPCRRKFDKESTSLDEINRFRIAHSWPKLVGDSLGIPFNNLGVLGNSNENIFKLVGQYILRGIVKEGDLVTVSFSSSLRDKIPFLWEDLYFKHPMIEGVNNTLQTFYGEWEKEVEESFSGYYRKFFVSNFHIEEYLKLRDLYYLVGVQKLLEYHKIKHHISFAFQNTIDMDDSTINLETVYSKGAKTFRDTLLSRNSPEYFSYQKEHKYRTSQKNHPSYLGYQVIAEEVLKDLNRLYGF